MRPAAILLLLLAFPLAASAQDRGGRPERVLFTGRVVDDATGRPILGAGITMSGARPVLTDGEGRFSVRLDAGEHEFSISQLGYDVLAQTLLLGEGAVTHEFRLTPRPVVLEAIQVIEDRFKRRRNAAATSVRVLDRSALLTAGHANATDFFRSRAGVMLTPCPGLMMSMSPCVLLRGRAQQVTVAIDDRPAFAGLDELSSYQPHELHMIEIYGNGRHVRAYTTWYMERAVRQRLQPLPLF